MNEEVHGLGVGCPEPQAFGDYFAVDLAGDEDFRAELEQQPKLPEAA